MIKYFVIGDNETHDEKVVQGEGATYSDAKTNAIGQYLLSHRVSRSNVWVRDANLGFTDTRGDLSIRDVCFNAFKNGMNPGQVVREYNFNPQTVWQYYYDWRRQE